MRLDDNRWGHGRDRVRGQGDVVVVIVVNRRHQNLNTGDQHGNISGRQIGTMKFQRSSFRAIRGRRIADEAIAADENEVTRML